MRSRNLLFINFISRSGINDSRFFILNLFFGLLIFLICPLTFSQWTNNISENTKLVMNTNSPVNISSIGDKNGGAFIVWQDNKNGFPSQIYFMHVNAEGKISFRADGKRVSDLSGPQENPKVCLSNKNSAIILWKDLTFSNSGSLFAQKIENNGNLLWPKNGVQITKGDVKVSEYSTSINQDGFTYVSYVAQKTEVASEYKVMVQKISPLGKIVWNSDGIMIYKSLQRKSLTRIIPDDSSGAYVFWLDYKNNKSEILAQHIDSTGKLLWGKKPKEISNIEHNVITYSLKKINPEKIYIVWQIQKSGKDIYHQLINYKGKNLWQSGGKLVTTLGGDQINPQAVIVDSNIVLSWTNEIGRNNDIYIQKFNEKGLPLWNKQGIPVIKYKGEQFGQKLISDGKNGVILTWIDRRIDSIWANIYAQKINENGKMVWDSLGLEVASNYNTPKSYLSLVPDGSGGAVVIFKNKRQGKEDIYGQRVFNTGTFIAQIIGFNTKLEGDSVKISWYSANERGSTNYNIERAAQTETDSMNWNVINEIHSDGGKNAESYVYYDVPQEQGTLYYRVVQIDSQMNQQVSDISRINYFGASSNVIVAQNFPNPFSDSTTISFYLPDSASVSVEFFDLHVDKINEIDKPFPSGENQIVFHSNGLAPGIYFYRFKVNNFVDVKKMVITN